MLVIITIQFSMVFQLKIDCWPTSDLLQTKFSELHLNVLSFSFFGLCCQTDARLVRVHGTRIDGCRDGGMDPKHVRLTYKDNRDLINNIYFYDCSLGPILLLSMPLLLQQKGH